MQKLTEIERKAAVDQATVNGCVDPQVLIDVVQAFLQEKNAFAWPTIEDYEKEIGYKVGMAAQIGWDMARTTNGLIKALASNSDDSDCSESVEDSNSASPAP